MKKHTTKTEPEVTVYKGERNKSYFVSTDAEVARKTAMKQLHNSYLDICEVYVLGDLCYFETPNKPGYKKMFAAYSR